MKNRLWIDEQNRVFLNGTQRDVEEFFGNINPDDYNNATWEELTAMLQFFVDEKWIATPCELLFKNRGIEISGDYQIVQTRKRTGEREIWPPRCRGTQDFADAVFDYLASSDKFVVDEGGRLLAHAHGRGVEVYADCSVDIDPDFAIIDLDHPRDSYSPDPHDYIYTMEEKPVLERCEVCEKDFPPEK